MNVLGLLASCDSAENAQEGTRLSPEEAALVVQRDRLIAEARALEASMKDSGSVDELRNELASLKEEIKGSRERVSELEFGIRKVRTEIETKFSK